MKKVSKVKDLVTTYGMCFSTPFYECTKIFLFSLHHRLSRGLTFALWGFQLVLELRFVMVRFHLPVYVEVRLLVKTWPTGLTHKASPPGASPDV